jgi:hypothetical protein
MKISKTHHRTKKGVIKRNPIKKTHNLTIVPTSVPRGKGNNPNAGKRDSMYKIQEWGYVFRTKEQAEKYANEHIEDLHGQIHKRN